MLKVFGEGHLRPAVPPIGDQTFGQNFMKFAVAVIYEKSVEQAPTAINREA